ncbi:MAG: hypothetical protein Q9183_000090 [Haloplaca sp. 2 TL-2023]
MHVSTILSLALVASPLAVSGYLLTGYLGGLCKTQQDYQDDFTVLKQQAGSSIVRTYSVIDVNVPQYRCEVAAAILPAAKASNVQVILGLWAESYESEKAALEPVLTSEYASTVYALTVGSESLYRGPGPENGGLEACDLLSRIDDARQTFGNIATRVGTADSWNKFQDGTADPLLSGKCQDKPPVPAIKFLLVNAFAYWQGKNISIDAVEIYLDDLQQAIGHIQEASGLNTVEIWNGETGWPGDGGSPYGNAEASTVNAEKFFENGVCAALAWGINVFYFSAFDESWKPKSVGDDNTEADETHWGAFTEDRVAKFKLAC